MRVSFTGITIYKTDMQNPYHTFNKAIKDKHLDNSMKVFPCTKDSKSVMLLDGADYENYSKRMWMLDSLYPSYINSYVSQSFRERQALEKKARIVDLSDLSLVESKRVSLVEI